MRAAQPHLLEDSERLSLRAVLFILSVVAGFVGQIVPRAEILFVASGVIFGAAMVGVGRQVLLAATAGPADKVKSKK